MVLADSLIRQRLEKGDLVVAPTSGNYDIFQQIGPASLDFRLGHTFRFYKRGHMTCIDPFAKELQAEMEIVQIPEWGSFVIHPGQFVLGVSLEKITLPPDLVARCEGRSSLGRLGLILHSTAGYIDPGFSGTVTLEVTNINEVPVVIYPGMRIGQFAFDFMDGVVECPYDKRKGSKYMHQQLPEASRVGQDQY